VFTWGGVEGLRPGQSTVEFLLEPDGGGTLVKLRHYDCHDLLSNRIVAAGSIPDLSKLKDAAEGRTPAALPQRHCPTGRRQRDKEVIIVNGWMLASGLNGLELRGRPRLCRIENMFYRPIKSAITNKLHVGILTGMWHLITIHFTLSAVCPVGSRAYGHLDAVACL